MKTQKQLLNDCFLHDKDRMKHVEVLEAIEKSLSLIVDDEIVSLGNAPERIAAEDIIAPRNVPLNDNSAVDGYAFSHNDYIRTDGKLGLGAFIAAGNAHTIKLSKGQCARIFTGAIMPQNADTVAMQEDCKIGNDELVYIPLGLKKGANCRKSGEDLFKGDSIIKAGTFLNPACIAALASVGIYEVGVRKKLRIAILSTGNEIIDPHNIINAGQVYDANRPMLKALLSCPQTHITDLGIALDNEAELTQKISLAAQTHDLILTSGGASRGDEDHMLDVLSNLGKRHIWQIAIKPGRPMMFGQINNCVIIGLPGNPVAAMVCSNLYIFPILQRLIGMIASPPRALKLPAKFEIKNKKKDRREFLRGWLETDENGQTCVAKFERNGSGLITGLRQSTGLIEIPEQVDKIEMGDLVDFMPFNAFKLDQRT